MFGYSKVYLNTDQSIAASNNQMTPCVSFKSEIDSTARVDTEDIYVACQDFLIIYHTKVLLLISMFFRSTKDSDTCK